MFHCAGKRGCKLVGLIEFFRDMLKHSFVLNLVNETAPNTWKHFEELIEEHRASPAKSRLKKLVNTVGTFFTPLPLCEAYLEYDSHYHVSNRRFLPISFDDVRHILNLAQVKASAHRLNLVTFDGDQTLYSDGKNFSDEKLAKKPLKSTLLGSITIMFKSAFSPL